MIDNPIHLILWSIWAAIVVLAICLACRHIFRIYRTSWYDLSRKGPLAELEWRQIREVMENDPLEIQPCCRWPWKQFCLDFPVLAILTLFFWSSVMSYLNCRLYRRRLLPDERGESHAANPIQGDVGGAGEANAERDHDPWSA